MASRREPVDGLVLELSSQAKLSVLLNPKESNLKKRLENSSPPPPPEFLLSPSLIILYSPEAGDWIILWVSFIKLFNMSML